MQYIDKDKRDKRRHDLNNSRRPVETIEISDATANTDYVKKEVFEAI